MLVSLKITKGKSRGVKGNQRASIIAKRSQEESRRVKRSKRGVKRRQEELRIYSIKLISLKITKGN